MGYESTIYLGLTSANTAHAHLSAVYASDEDGNPDYSTVVRQAHYTQVVAMVDVSKAGYQNRTGLLLQAAREAEKARLAQGTEDEPVHGYGIYVSGNDFADRDLYDDPVSPVDLDALIDALDADYAEDPYRRFALLAQVLRAWRDLLGDFGGPDRAVVLHYGH